MMASDLLSIAASGTRAARAALDVTAQNIANAATDGYVRRSAQLAELAATNGYLRAGDRSLSGVRVAGIQRHADLFRQAEVRRTTSDLARASTELGGLESIEGALEQAAVYPAMIAFEAAVQHLETDTANPSLRAAVMASAEGLARSFNLAATELDAVETGLHFDATAKVDEVNNLGAEIARTNLRLSRTTADSSGRATLLDQRDRLLERLSTIANVSSSFAADGSVTVTLGAGATAPFVSGDDHATLAMAVAQDGTISFTADGAPISATAGSLSGNALALAQLAVFRTRLDGLADGISTTVNTAQANGVATDGSAGSPLFSGSGAAAIALAFVDGAGIAAAPAGAPAHSLDASNLMALRRSLDSTGAASGISSLLFDASNLVASRVVTRDALDTIASSARSALEQQAGVDLDTEAANLVRFQQAFQASGRAMQVASDIFDTLIGIG